MIMRIMTNNIWGDYFGNPVSVREDGLYDCYMKYMPDVIGFQEATKNWHNSKLFSELSENYEFVGTEFFGCKNYVPLVYKKSSGVNLMAKGYEMLSETPDESKAITWAVLQKPQTGAGIAVCNTHFWWKPGKEHDEIREKNALQLSSLMKYLYSRYSFPVIAFGDMNCTESSGVFKIYSENGIMPLRSIADEKSNVSSHHGDPLKGEDGRYHGKKTSDDYTHSIDHIIGLGKDIKVKSYIIVEDESVLDATDHSPVYADIVL